MTTDRTSYEVHVPDCIRCASCATVAPDHYRVDGRAATLYRAPEPGPESWACDTAALVCPTGAIRCSEPSVGGLPDSVGCDEPYSSLLQTAEGVRWKVAELPWATFDSAQVAPALRAVVHEMAFYEQATYSATQRFMQAFADDPDFTQWVSVWFYEETRHPMVLLRWLDLAGDNIDADFVARGRVSSPFMRSLTGTLVTNIASEIVAASAYLALARASPEPLLAAICRRIAADEARHAASFFRYARRRIRRAPNPLREQLDAVKVLHFWLNESQNVTHPVNQTMARLRQIDPEAAGLPIHFELPRRRICSVVGQLTSLPISGPEAVEELLAKLTAQMHAV